MNILLVPYDGVPAKGRVNLASYSLVLQEGEDGNFTVTKNLHEDIESTNVTVWDPEGTR